MDEKVGCAEVKETGASHHLLGDQLDMSTTINTRTAAAHRALGILLARANGGSTPTLSVHIREGGGAPDPLFGAGEMRDALLVTLAQDGGLDTTVMIGTHWTVLRHEGFRFALTPSGQTVLLGRHRERPIFFYLEEDRLHCDYGSPLLSRMQEAEAARAFDAAFHALLAEGC